MEAPEKGTRILMTTTCSVKQDSELNTDAIGTGQSMSWKGYLCTDAFCQRGGRELLLLDAVYAASSLGHCF